MWHISHLAGSTEAARSSKVPKNADFSWGVKIPMRDGIAMAYALKDNRPSCKYICPVSVPLKITSRLSLLKIGQGNGQCNDCGACEKMCPSERPSDSPAVAAAAK